VLGIFFRLADGCAHISEDIAAFILGIEVCRRKCVQVLQSFQTWRRRLQILPKR